MNNIGLILSLILAIIISIVGLPVIENPSSIELAILIFIYLVVCISILYMYFTISKITDMIDTYNSGIKLAKNTVKLASDMKSKKISIKDIIKLMFNIKSKSNGNIR